MRYAFLDIFCLIAISVAFYPCAEAQNSVDSKTIDVEYSRLAKVKGADMTIFDLFLQNKDKDRDKAAQYAEIFLDKINLQTESPLVADMQVFLANHYEKERNRFSPALALSKPALQTFLNIGNLTQANRTRIRMARLYLKKDRFDSAYMMLHDALGNLEKGERADRIECNQLLGVIFSRAGDAELSSRYFQECVKLAQQTHDSIRVVTGLVNSSALSFLSGGSLKKAHTLLEEAANVARQSGEKDKLAGIYLNIAGLYVSEKDFVKTKEYLEKARKYVKNIEERGLMSKIKAQSQIMQDSVAEAIDELHRCIAIYNKGEFDPKLKDVYSTLVLLYNNTGNETQALHYSIIRDSLLDRLDSQNVYNNLFRMQKDSEIEDTKKQLEGRFSNRLLWICVFCVLAVMLAASGTFYLCRRMARRKLAEYEMSAEQQQKNINDISVFRKDTIIKDATTRLKQIIIESRGAKVKADLTEVCQTLESACDDRTLKEIENYVPGFNSELYRRLVKDFPNLTPNESRICVLVAMNMSTKQISDITKQSVDAINMSRTRLRRKLELTGKNVSLQEFLNQYR